MRPGIRYIRMMDWRQGLLSAGCLVVCLLALYEGVTGVAQLSGISRSLNLRYPFTGTFYNPGPFACYLAFSFPIAIDGIMRVYAGRKQGSDSGLINYAVCGVAFLISAIDVFLLPSSMSRTAWFAALAGTAVATLELWLPIFRRNRILMSILITSVVVGSLFLAFKLKEASASGRFLMWKIAASAVDPSPFRGVGWQYVAGTYGDAQEMYFASGSGTENEIMVAGTPEYVFNEYLQVAIAYGWGWTLLIVALMAGAFFSAIANKRYGIAGAIVSVALVMVSSYPLQFRISILTIGIIILLGYLSAKRLWIMIPGIVLTLAGTLFLLNDCKKYEAEGEFQKGMSFHRAGKWDASNGVMWQLLPHLSDPMPLNVMGKNYTELGERDSAEYCLRRSASRCPNRLYPH